MTSRSEAFPDSPDALARLREVAEAPPEMGAPREGRPLETEMSGVRTPADKVPVPRPTAQGSTTSIVRSTT